MKKSILKMLDRLNPKKIVVVSSAPQIRYPDCYGIDMANLESLVAFRAALELLKDNNMYDLVETVYNKCKAQINLKDKKVKNFVREIYNPFTDEQISDKISELLSDNDVKAEIKIIFSPLKTCIRPVRIIWEIGILQEIILPLVATGLLTELS